MKYIIEFDDFLNESKELDIANKYKSVIPDNMFIILSKIDVTPTRKYLDKICNFFVNDKAPDNSKVENIHHVFTNFDYLSNKKIIKGADSDITKYKTLKDLASVVDKYSKIESELLEKKLKKSNIIKIRDDKDLFICVPLDEESSKIYGSNTRWCISAKENNAYDMYFSSRTEKPINKTKSYYKSLLKENINEAGGGGGGSDNNKECFVSFIINKKLETSNPLHKIGIQFTITKMKTYHSIYDSLDCIDYKHCIETSKNINIELPKEYHDIMKTCNGYENYIEKYLNININELEKDIKSKYFVYEKNKKSKYEKYLDFISPSRDILDNYSFYLINERFHDNSDKIPKELENFNKLLGNYDRVDCKILCDYYIEVEKFCKKYNIKNKISKIRLDFTSGDLHKTLDIYHDLPIVLDTLNVDNCNDFENFDKKNIKNRFETTAIRFNNIKQEFDNIPVKLNNSYVYYLLTENKDPEFQKNMYRSFSQKYNIKKDNISGYSYIE